MEKTTSNYTPIRRCVGCGRRFAQNTLLRVTGKGEEGMRVTDKGSSEGRSAYLCRDLKCYRNAKKRGSLAKSLHTAVPEHLWEQIALMVGEKE